MTISNTDTAVSYTGNSVTTVFDFDFNIPLAADATVTLFDSTDESTVTLDPADYTITGLGVDAGGSVTYPLVGSPIPSTQIITIMRVLDIVQETDLANQAGFYPEAITDALDYLTMVCQQQQTDIDNCLAFPLGSTTTAAELITAILNGEANADAAEAAAADAEAAQAATEAALAAAFPVQTANIGDLQVTTGKLAANAVTAAKLATSSVSSGVNLVNGTLSVTVAANAITIAVKTLAGADPSASDPVYVVFRNVTATTGNYVVRTLTAALTMTVSSGSTMGFASGIAGRIWIVAFDDAGTVRLGAINCRSTGNIYPLGGVQIASSTAEGGAGAADSAHVFYTGTAVTSKAYTILGYGTWDTGPATAGTWATSPTQVQLLNMNVTLPGKEIQEAMNATGAVNSGTTVIPSDDTIPQITEGVEFMTQAIVPSSAANLLDIEAQLFLASSASSQHMAAALFQDAAVNALATAAAGLPTNSNELTLRVLHRMVAGTLVSTTLRCRAGGSAAGTTSFNGVAAARKYGGVANSFLRVKEIMA